MCHHTRATLLERSRGQVREGRDFSAEIPHEEARLQEACRSSLGLRSSETTAAVKTRLYLRFRSHSKLICSTVRVEPIKYVYVFYKCYNRWTDSVCGRRAYIAPSAVLVYPRSVNTADWVCSSIYWHLLAAFLCNVLSVAFMISPEGSNIPKKVFKMSPGVSYSFEWGSLFQEITSTS